MSHLKKLRRSYGTTYFGIELDAARECDAPSQQFTQTSSAGLFPRFSGSTSSSSALLIVIARRAKPDEAISIWLASAHLGGDCFAPLAMTDATRTSSADPSPRFSGTSSSSFALHGIA